MKAAIRKHQEEQRMNYCFKKANVTLLCGFAVLVLAAVAVAM